MADPGKGWTPPKDAIVDTTGWTPPADAVEWVPPTDAVVEEEEQPSGFDWRNPLPQGAADFISSINRGISEAVTGGLGLLGAAESEFNNALGLGERGQGPLARLAKGTEQIVENINPVSPEFEQSITGQVAKGIGQG